ncbi:hypothetical protein [Terriglobus roseus]|uniref:PQQ-like domain-containing protein n=1 Tax=Terriglobus roseus TaxID=392734 RepID=A0A1H4IY76_9BACT|nr:hypothetical protein [Terriglobus roseus]SEB38917.1 hypothetical protein SAMN05443244_0192 [Terriglobus roseus]
MKIASLLLCATISASAQNVLTKSYDVARTSENRSETILTPAKVAQGMTMLPRIPCIGDARGCEAQPLIDGNVMILASDANVIRGVNPIGGAAIWQTPQLCAPVRSIPGNDMWRVQTNFGMLSTGVIDADTHKLYQDATCSSDGSGSQQSMQQKMFVLDDRSGTVLASTILDATSNGQRYSAAPRKQRSALALWSRNGTKFIIIAAGSFTESGPDATGWILAFDTFDLKVKAALATRAGIWMSSQGPAIDSDGFIYAGAGNGSFNGTTDFGEASMKLQFVPSTATTAASLSVVGAWAPFSDSSRECGNVQLTNAKVQVSAVTGATPGAQMPMNSGCNSQWTDQDAHLSGTLVERFHQYITAGKDGIGYVVPTRSFPQTAPADFKNPKANCAKVALYEFGWDLGIDPCPVKLSTLNQFFGGKTRHQHAPIAHYTAPDGTFYLLMMAENSPLQMWRADTGGIYHFVGRSAEVASPQSTGNGGMPGGFCSVSDSNGANAIAWCSVPNGDANRTVTTGFLYGYDLTKLIAGQPPLIFKSEQYTYSKFSQPIVHNGTVILADYAGSVMEWKLSGQ